MKSTTIIIAGAVVVVGYIVFKKFGASISKMSADARTASYGTGTPESESPASFWNGSNWESGPSAPGNTAPNGAKPLPPTPLDSLATLSAQAWGNASALLARKQPAIGQAVTATERVGAQSLPVPTIY